LFDSINVADAPEAPQASQRIAMAWAQRDPRAAAGWAASISDEESRAAAARSIAGQWATREPNAARGWALGLPVGKPRDAALTQILGVTATSTIDAVVLDGFSNDEAREGAISYAVRAVATRDAAAARQLADRYLTSPDARRAAERFIAQDGNGPVLSR
jgi:hypothetical protein